MRQDLTLPELAALLDYDPVSGALTWRERSDVEPTTKTWNTRFAGARAGRMHMGCIRVRNYSAAKVCVYKMIGLIPRRVRFLDGDSSNLRRDNLEYDLYEDTEGEG